MECHKSNVPNHQPVHAGIPPLVGQASDVLLSSHYCRLKPASLGECGSHILVPSQISVQKSELLEIKFRFLSIIEVSLNRATPK